MRNSTAATGKSLDLHSRPVSGCVSKTEQKRMPVQFKRLCSQYCGLCILNTILQVAIKQDESYYNVYT